MKQKKRAQEVVFSIANGRPVSFFHFIPFPKVLFSHKPSRKPFEKP